MYIQQSITISNELGLHARAAAKLVKLCTKFASDITLILGDVRVNAKSIMGLLMLGASNGTQLQIEANGYDNEEALTAVKALINDKFGEAQ